MFFDKEKRGTTLYCFSPQVVLATFLIEAGLALYVWWRYRATGFGRLMAIFLGTLSVFQLAEFAICMGGPSIEWTRIGFIAITFLPIIGIDAVARLGSRKVPMYVGYALALAIAVIIGFFPNLFEAAQCTGRYVLFHSTIVGFDVLYSIYYLASLFIGLGMALDVLKRKTPHRRALLWLLLGYATFIVPTFVLYVASIVTVESFPSVFCGFAVFLALICVFKVMPLVHRKVK